MIKSCPLPLVADQVSPSVGDVPGEFEVVATCSSRRPIHARARYGRWNRWPGSRQARRAERLSSAQLPHALLTEADVTCPARANKTVLLRLLTLHREDSYMQFSHAVKRAGAIRTLESLARIEAGAQGGALIERTTTTRTAKSGAITGWPARSSRVNLSRPARLPLVADQVSSAVTLAASLPPLLMASKASEVHA